MFLKIAFPGQRKRKFTGNRFVEAHIHGNAEVKVTTCGNVYSLGGPSVTIWVPDIGRATVLTGESSSHDE
jgi:hypothetical protein